MIIYKTPDRQYCWVNSETPPNKVKRLKVFKYCEDDFFELCEYSYYETEDSVTIEHKLLTWERIFVPLYKMAALKAQIDTVAILGSS